MYHPVTEPLGGILQFSYSTAVQRNSEEGKEEMLCNKPGRLQVHRMNPEPILKLFDTFQIMSHTYPSYGVCNRDYVAVLG